MATTPGALGQVTAIWRYPVKSMMGEELNATAVTTAGVLGDRAYGLVDVETGKIASAKNPRRWPNLFDFRAVYVEPPTVESALPAVRIVLPNGDTLTSAQPDADGMLSATLGRTVLLSRTPAGAAGAEGYWPDQDGLPGRDEVFEFSLPAGTFFDGATIHLVTTATLDRLRLLSPTSRFEVPRFRPNFVIDPGPAPGFVENDWIGRTFILGTARIRIDGPCPRCVMTTLSQGSLPRDVDVLRTIVRANGGNAGMYATVIKGGRVQRGDAMSGAQA